MRRLMGCQYNCRPTSKINELGRTIMDLRSIVISAGLIGVMHWGGIVSAQGIDLLGPQYGTALSTKAALAAFDKVLRDDENPVRVPRQPH